MAKIESLSHVGVFVRDQKKAKEFYTKKLGLAVRASIPKMGYLALGATKGGKDASLNLWQPTREMWGPDYENALKQIGGVTGIGFLTTNLAKTLETLKAKGVKVQDPGEEGMATVFDPDGNALFVFEPPKPKVRRAGLRSLEFVTIASRDANRAGEFFTKALGMKSKKLPQEGMTEYRLTPGGTALTPFTPNPEFYKDPKDFENDMAHIGENTSIMFSTKDIYGVQDRLTGRGVRFQKKAAKAEWGGIDAEFLDPDDNRYALIQEMPENR
ncbi:MAG TPA: VOC family protein [Thermoplasmata archaeon]|nr:VOC family protein [Thermoplasmata archaeon]